MSSNVTNNATVPNLEDGFGSTLSTIWNWGISVYYEPLFYYIVAPISVVFFGLAIYAFWSASKNSSQRACILGAICLTIAGFVWSVVIIIVIAAILALVAMCCLCAGFLS